MSELPEALTTTLQGDGVSTTDSVDSAQPLTNTGSYSSQNIAGDVGNAGSSNGVGQSSSGSSGGGGFGLGP